MRTSEPQSKTDTGLSEIAWLSSQDKTQTFHSLMHHINIDSLRGCYHKLDGKKAMGADRVSKEMYGENLLENLDGLIERMKRMGYRPQPVREVRIPKEGKKGATRPLGISNFEDKVVQKRMQEVLESIYDPIFVEWSYGFRPGRGDAIRVRRALSRRLEKYRLSLNEDKTKMVKFSKNNQRKGEKQEVFNFLGFTFYLGRSLTGVIVPKLKTEGKRFRTKLQRVKAWCREKRNEVPTLALWKTFCAKLRGHIQYYGVSHNSGRVEEFIAQARRIVFKWLNRRSQRRSFDWIKFERFLKIYPLPKVKVHHKLF